MFSVVCNSIGSEVEIITTGTDETVSLSVFLRDALMVRKTTLPEGRMAAADTHISIDDLDNYAKTASMTISNEKIETVSIPVTKK